MKKILKSILAITLVLTMMVPLVALAEEETAVPADINADLYDTLFWEFWVQWSGEDTIEGFMEWYLDMFSLGELEWRMDGTFWEFFWFSSQAEFMSTYELNEAQYLLIEEAWEAAMVDARVRIEVELEAQRQAVQAEIRARGGTPGITNVMINDTFIRFDGAVPITIDGLAFVPASAFFSAMGWSTNFDSSNGTLLASQGENRMRFVIGEDIVFMEWQNGWLEAVPFIRDGVTYIPIASTARLMGLSVFWDPNASTVILLDANAVIAEIDRDFTIANRLINTPVNLMQTGNGTSMTVMDIIAVITSFNSIDGDVVVDVDSSFTIISDGLSSSLMGTVNVSGLMEFLLAETVGFHMHAEEMSMMVRMATALSDAEIEIIFNEANDTMYIYAPFLSEVVPGLPENTWISFEHISDYLEFFGVDISNEDISLSSVMGISSVGEMVFPGFWRFSRNQGSIDMFSQILDSFDIRRAREMFGDNQFVRSGRTYTLSSSSENAASAAQNIEDIFLRGRMLPGFDIQIVAEINGGVITTASGSINTRDQSWNWDVLDVIEFDISSEAISLSIYNHTRNESRTELTMNIVSTDTDDTVTLAPPSGALIISIYEASEIIDRLIFNY